MVVVVAVMTVLSKLVSCIITSCFVIRHKHGKKQKCKEITKENSPQGLTRNSNID